MRAVKLMMEEGYYADADDFTNDAAAICTYHSDWESVAYWSLKTYESRVAEFGGDSPRASDEEILQLLRNPENNPYTGLGMKISLSEIRL